ncbi:hypothetical protein K2Y11_08830 [bacterium]|nr:hypothetical protein [bacterium]
MVLNAKARTAILLALVITAAPALAQRGGRGGGGARGGFSEGSRGAGGFGGGMSREGGGYSRPAGDGGYSRAVGNGGMTRSPDGGFDRNRGGVGGPDSGVGARPGAGAGRAGLGGPDSGIGVRPGMGAGRAGVGGPDSGVGFRPGMGAGAPGVGGPDSGIGYRPGAGAGAAGVGLRPGVGVGGPDSGVGVFPGMGAGAAGLPGTHYAGAAALADQGAAVRDAAVGYPDYAARLAAYPNAWRPAAYAGSMYANPGYAATAAMLGLAAQPNAYDYGSNVVAQPTNVYVNGDSAGTPQEYTQQASQVASAGAADPSPDSKWLPLGIFAVCATGATTSDDTFQLAVNPDGIIRGNYHNKRNDQVLPITGSVDKNSQKAAWTIGSDKNPVYEAGISNLTKDETTMLVLPGDGTTTQMTLIRLPEPAQTADAAPAPTQ